MKTVRKLFPQISAALDERLFLCPQTDPPIRSSTYPRIAAQTDLPTRPSNRLRAARRPTPDLPPTRPEPTPNRRRPVAPPHPLRPTDWPTRRPRLPPAQSNRRTDRRPDPRTVSVVADKKSDDASRLRIKRIVFCCL